MARYLDPKSDIVFKKIFGDHPHLLISFLNAVLPLAPEGKIVSLTYLSNENIPKIPILKRTIADVRCVDEQGRVFVVEMQINWTDGFKERLLFEASQAYVKQLEKGEQYHLLQPVYGLGLINAIFDKQSAEWYHHYQLVNVMKPVRETIEGLQLIFIELPKLTTQGITDDLRLLWLRFMREVNEKMSEVASELLAVPAIQEAVTLSEEAAYTRGELSAYEEYWDVVSVEKTIQYGGYLEGKAEGRAEGRAEGKAEALSSTFHAIELLKQGVAMQEIANQTGLNFDELALLRKQMFD